LLYEIFLLDNIVTVVDLRYSYEHKKVGIDHEHGHLSQVTNEGERFLSLLLDVSPDKLNFILSALNLFLNMKQVQSFIKKLFKRSRLFFV